MEALQHSTTEQLELYALGRLDPADTASIEEHLLLCSACQQHFEEVESFALGMKDVLSQDPVQEPKAAKPAIDWFGWLRSPSFALAGGVAFILLVGIVLTQSGKHSSLPTAVAIQVSAMRGDAINIPAAKELDITLTDAPATGSPFRADLVDGTGRKVWSGVSKQEEKGVKVRAKVGSIEPGEYFLRLYSTGGDLIHEYGLHVQ